MNLFKNSRITELEEELAFYKAKCKEKEEYIENIHRALNKAGDILVSNFGDTRMDWLKYLLDKE